MADSVQCVVVGAGVVGLAVARALALQGREVLVLEAEAAVGTQTSARSSEVIHAGIYYPVGSLKARLCVQGSAMLYDYCARRQVAHRRCGKLIVATSERQLPALRQLAAQASANGVQGLRWLDGAGVRSLEPALRCHGALLSPATGIIDSHALMLALQADLQHSGATVVLRTRVDSVARTAQGFRLGMHDGSELLTALLVNAAGVQAPALARRIQGLAPAAIPRSFHAKGNYFACSVRAPFSHLIYPLPEPAGLGVHLTLDLAGQARFGPDVQWVDSPDELQVDAARAEAFHAEIRRYWPELPAGALQPDYAGMRPKISGPGEPAADFLIQGPSAHGVPGLVNLFGIESPGLTSCLALGDYVAVLSDVEGAR
ncbi:NAD(P)/FAD-dependent oxidoreductase [Comamonas sp. NLF-1-9]|uniref:NAD(P)/FAD-dependent oxidoreductase n=1 Tax=Comamonas sp. NLF-1-9 TaxID=2853163 RepID=UPI001C467792|nr:NAD(P)/FAD-dependent oxidoreductase [Comamonas sp. NLF-1-9]QXL85335.1 NAD(P)/FAD-dependent oxidoreductase [Comamonas sp. NLF-1-9]